ncbi:hypothetical protein V2H45_07350 [Tumidithrix elongata RA019]|uniref:Uncharacterized protein n=1 Tax=Tumidithrix elongata BACA0141 TaxID=2716417 RepID=A0AAW9PRG9_9CYAN|nr:hypothetical protein [Tumidithrix elongata RA019]
MNRHKRYVIVLPEDRADEQIANGFSNHLNVIADAIKVERPAGGWTKVLAKFSEALVPEMQKFSKCLIVLLIDFDQNKNRLRYMQSQIPEDLKERVFILGSWSNPESLKKDMKKSFEDIGESLANDCSDNTNQLWGHDLLKHNKGEIDRMVSSVKPFLFKLQ